MAVARLWAAALGSDVDEDSTPDRAFVEAPGWGGPNMWFVQVPEPKTAKNRIHLDIHVAAEERDMQIARLIALGATKLWDGQQGPQTWVTLADPEGNEFCIS